MQAHAESAIASAKSASGDHALRRFALDDPAETSRPITRSSLRQSEAIRGKYAIQRKLARLVHVS